MKQRTRECQELTWFGDGMACDASEFTEFVGLDLEALDIKVALDFRAFVLQSCTSYTIKKNEVHNRRPHFISRIYLLLLWNHGYIF